MVAILSTAAPRPVLSRGPERRSCARARWPPARAGRAQPRALMLAEVYRRGMPLDDYWVSEKFDGVRGYWDGKQLWTRGGERVVAPAWFTAPLPPAADGRRAVGRPRPLRRTRCRPCAARRPTTRPGARSASWCSTCRRSPATSRARLAALRKLLPMHRRALAGAGAAAARHHARGAAGAARQDGAAGRRRPDAASRRLALPRPSATPIC